MTRHEQTAAQALLRTNDYAATLVPDFTYPSPTKVDLKVATARERLTRAIADLGGRQSKLTAMLRRIYKGNHEAAWKSASHVQRAARPAAQVKPSVTPPPSPS